MKHMGVYSKLLKAKLFHPFKYATWRREIINSFTRKSTINISRSFIGYNFSFTFLLAKNHVYLKTLVLVRTPIAWGVHVKWTYVEEPHSPHSKPTWSNTSYVWPCLTLPHIENPWKYKHNICVCVCVVVYVWSICLMGSFHIGSCWTGHTWHDDIWSVLFICTQLTTHWNFASTSKDLWVANLWGCGNRSTLENHYLLWSSRTQPCWYSWIIGSWYCFLGVMILCKTLYGEVILDHLNVS